MASAAGKVASGIGRAAAGTAKAAGAGAAAGVTATATTGGKVLRTPGRIVRTRTRSASQLFWGAIVTLLALSLFVLVLRAASTQPARLNGAVQWLPNALRRFVNPWPAVQGPPAPPGLLAPSAEDAPETEGKPLPRARPVPTRNPHVLNVNVVNHSNRKVTVT